MNQRRAENDNIQAIDRIFSRVAICYKIKRCPCHTLPIYLARAKPEHKINNGETIGGAPARQHLKNHNWPPESRRSIPGRPGGGGGTRLSSGRGGGAAGV